MRAKITAITCLVICSLAVPAFSANKTADGNNSISVKREHGKKTISIKPDLPAEIDADDNKTMNMEIKPEVYVPWPMKKNRN
ncbi:MAG: hypothetical protein ACQES5_03965 [Thermodesulfobacteriota bacterium]